VRLYGGQLQDRAIGGVPAEGHIRITYRPLRGRFGDGTPYTLQAPRYEIVDRAFGRLPAGVQVSPRVAPAVFGVGLLQAVPESAIVEHADAGDRDGDGISGRPNRVPDASSPTTALTGRRRIAAARARARHERAGDGAGALWLEGERADGQAVERRRLQRRYRRHVTDLPRRELPARAARVSCFARRRQAGDRRAQARSRDVLHAHARGPGAARRRPAGHVGR